MECCKTIREENVKKKLTTRINKIIGQMNGINNMIMDDRYCGDILIQLAAIEKSIKSAASVLLEEHMKTCMLESVKKGETEKIDEIIELFKRF